MFLGSLAAENLKNTIPAPSAVACRRRSNSNSNSVSHIHNSSRSIGTRQFRAGIVFLAFVAAENLKNTIPAPLFGGVSGEDPKISIPVVFRGEDPKSRFQVEKRQMTPWRIKPATLPKMACDSSACQLSYDRLADCAGGCLKRRSE